jgi:uncharacterized membrane protein YidH (DUF202 family)
MGSENPRPPKSTRFRLVQPFTRIFAALLMLWGGLRTVALGSALLGIFLFVCGGITAALAARELVNRVRSRKRVESSGELATYEFDYIMWTALGLPVLLVLGLLAFVLTGSR